MPEESPLDRKLRILTDQVERLTALVDTRPTSEPAEPEEPQGVPEPVAFAFHVMRHFHAAKTPELRQTNVGTITMEAIDLGAEELMALGSASSLLSAYFDDFNPRLRAGAHAAQVQPKHVPGPVPN